MNKLSQFSSAYPYFLAVKRAVVSMKSLPSLVATIEIAAAPVSCSE